LVVAWPRDFNPKGAKVFAEVAKKKKKKKNYQLDE
jgi:hypothetical protein